MNQTAYDKVIAALTIWREARSQSQAARNGVFHVILNRAAQSPKEGWPNTVHGVCVQPFQFSSFNLGATSSVQWPLEKNTADWNAWQEIQQMIDSPLLADPTQGAQFYVDDSADLNATAKSWLGPGKTSADLLEFKTIQIGALSFFKI